MTQSYSMFIAGKIIEMPSVKFFLKHPVANLDNLANLTSLTNLTYQSLLDMLGS